MIAKISNFFKKYRKIFLIVALAATGIFGVVPGARAGIFGDMLKNASLAAVGGIVQIWVWLFGQLAVQLVYLIIYLASYNNFVHSSAVENGWVIIRDVVNMFFIVILLVIAFSTMFDISGKYFYKQMLPRLLIMAVVINFSRTIAGILIDFGQVVMLTFVNGFQAAAGGNFMKALKIEELMQFRAGAGSQSDDTSFTKVLASLFLAALMITITAVVLGAFAIMLVIRIVTLWFLIVLSPLAFMASVWPSGRISQKYGAWWDMFLDNIMVGPILAFFLWLSLLVLGNGDIGKTEIIDGGTYKESGEASLNAPSTGYTKVGTTDNMLSYLIGIGMLIGSLAMAQQMRSAGGGVAGAALGYVKKYSTGAVKWTGKKAGKRALRAGEGAVLPVLGLASRLPPVLGGGLALKGAAKLQAREKERGKEETAYIANLTPEQKQRRLATLRRGRLNAAEQHERAALEKGNLKEIMKQNWSPELEREFRAGTGYLRTREIYDPEIGEKMREAEDKRKDLLTPPRRAAALRDMQVMDVLKEDNKSFTSNAYISDLYAENRPAFDYAEAYGNQVKKNAIAAWRTAQHIPAPAAPPPLLPGGMPGTPGAPPPPPAPATPPPPVPPVTPPPPTTPPPIPPTTPPPVIPAPAGGVPPVTPSSATPRPRPPRPTGSGTPLPASATSQERIASLVQGGPVENIYQVDAIGNFKNNNASEQFNGDLKEFKESLSKDKESSDKNIGKLFGTINGLKGQMGSAALKSLNKNDFSNYMQMLRRTGALGKGGADEQNLKKTIRKYMSETEGNKDMPEVKETREYIENNSVTNQYISEGEEEKKT